MVTMLSAFSCMTSCHIGANFRVPAVVSPFRMKNVGARKRSGWAECACVHVFGVVSSRHRHPTQPHLRSGLSNSYPSLHFGFLVASYNGGTPHPLAIKEVICETMSEKASTNQPTNAASKFSLIGLPVVALALSIGFVGQPAYATVKPAVLAEVGVEMEVVGDRAPSVETILAKQLARRFREMSDEELVDILQQLLKASRSSLNSQNAVDGGTVPQDLIIQRENREVETKPADRIREEVRVPPTQETDTSRGKSATHSERTGGEAPLPRANKKINGLVDKRTGEKFYDKTNSKEPQGQVLPGEVENVEKARSKARFSETQETLRGGNSATPGAPSTENNSGDASVRSDSDSPATSGRTSAAELSSDKADNNAKGGVREEEDLTELLWTEWSRRAGGQVMQEPKTSTSSFNFAKFGQDFIVKVAALNFLQSPVGVLIIWFFFMVLAFYLGRSRAASMRKQRSKSKDSWINSQGNETSKSKKAKGDLELGSATSSRVPDYFVDSGNSLKEFMSKGDRESDANDRGEKSYEEDFLFGEGETSTKDDQPQKGKRWRTPFLLKEAAAGENQRIVDQLPRESIIGTDGEEDLNNLSSPSSNGGASIDSTNSEATGSDEINSKMEQFVDQSSRDSNPGTDGEEDLDNLSSPSSNGGASIDSTNSGATGSDEINSEMEQFVDQSSRDSIPGNDVEEDLNSWPSPSSDGGTRSDSTSSGASGFGARNSEMEQLQDRPAGEETSGVPQTPLYSSRASVNSVDNSSSELRAADNWNSHIRSQSAREVDWRNAKVEGVSDNYPSGEEEDQGEPSTSSVQYIGTMSKRDVVFNSQVLNLDHGRATSRTGDVYSGIFEKLSARRFVHDRELYEQVRQKDSLEDFSRKQEEARAGEDSPDSQSEAKLNSFVHDHVLWVRDVDGIFIRQALTIEEYDNQATSLSRGEEDMPKSTLSFDAERRSMKVEKSNPPSSVPSMKPRRGPQTGFDYRRLVIEPRGEFNPGEQQWAATESEPTAVRQHMQPLRYMSGRQEVSQ